MNVPVHALLQAILQNITNHTVSGNFDGALRAAKIGLFTNAPSLTVNTVLADLTEPTYTGYTQQSITWTGPFREVNNQWELLGGLHTFQMSNNLTPTTVVGIFVCDSTSTNLLYAEAFPAPIPLQTSDNALQYVPGFAAGGGNWGGGTVLN